MNGGRDMVKRGEGWRTESEERSGKKAKAKDVALRT